MSSSVLPYVPPHAVVRRPPVAWPRSPLVVPEPSPPPTSTPSRRAPCVWQLLGPYARGQGLGLYAHGQGLGRVLFLLVAIAIVWRDVPGKRGYERICVYISGGRKGGSPYTV